jgi:hypothetical protein
MAITVTTPTAKNGFILNATSADASGCEELKAAESGKTIKVRQLTMSNNSVGTLTMTIGGGETGGAVTAALLGPVSLLTGQSMSWTFNPDGSRRKHGPVVDASGAGAICVFAQGEVE